MHLYEITQDYQTFLAFLDENPDLPYDAISDTIEAIEGNFTEKADNIACLIKSLESEAIAIKAEETALKARRESKEKHAERLRQYLSDHMQLIGKDKIETPRNVLGFRKSVAVQIADEESFKATYPNYCTTKVTISKSEVSKTLKSGEALDGAVLVENKNLFVR